MPIVVVAGTETVQGMRIVICDCSVDYEGRLSAHLPLARRTIMFKGDGSVLVHADIGGFKPLNWMMPPTVVSSFPDRFEVVSGKEHLTIHVAEIICDISEVLGAEPGLVKTGTERDIQEALGADPGLVEPGLVLVSREYETGIGPVDLVCRDPHGAAVAIEVKRTATPDAVDQLCRYIECLDRNATLAPVRGMVAALTVKPQTRVLAADRGIGWVELDADELAGVESPELRLF